MTENTYSCGNDNFPKDNRQYAFLDTDKGKLIAIALETSGVPHFGSFSENTMRFSYDADYKDTVDEIISKAKSSEYDEMFREIKEKKDDSGYLILLPSVAYYLHLTEGTLRQRPDELQIQLCQMFTQLWCCDTPTIQRELTRVLNANRETEKDMESAKENVKPEQTVNEEIQKGLISREVIRRQAEMIRRKQAVKEKMIAERYEIERKF